MPSSSRYAFTVASTALAAALLLAVSALEAQKAPPRSDPDGPDPKVGLTIALQVGTGRYDFTGQGVCLEIPDGSIYDAPAAMYSVRQTTDKQRLNMTLYRLKKGGDMLTLNVSSGNETHSVSTVKVAANGTVAGSGSAKLERTGKGGTLTIEAADPKGVKISGTVKCEAFNRPVESNGL
jgi:hypothetical protein